MLSDSTQLRIAAAEALGITVCLHPMRFGRPCCSGTRLNRLPDPLNSVSDALVLVMKAREEGWGVVIDTFLGKWRIWFVANEMDEHDCFATDVSLNRAILLAFLKLHQKI